MTTTLNLTGRLAAAPLQLAGNLIAGQSTALELDTVRGARTQTLILEDDDPVALELDGGARLWVRASEARTELARLDSASRGPGVAGLVRAVRHYRLDACASAVELASWLEARQLAGPAGLYRMQLTDGGIALAPSDPPPAADAPLLICIHGTAASCAATFAGLARPAAQPLRTALAQRYGERIYAWQYRSITVGPLENALALLQQLPDGAQVDLLTHSQGGLQADLLSLGAVPTPTNSKRIVDAEQLAAWFAIAGARPGAIAPDLQLCTTLLDLLAQKRICVRHCVRIACPAMGTTLASGRLDRWLSAFEYAATLAGLDVMTGDLLGFILAVVRQRTDPRLLPGLAAMMPGAPLLRLLNWHSLQADSSLTVVAGDIEAGTVWRRLELLLADEFFAGAHDLVVNTGSMYGGLRRKDAHCLFEHSAAISHFTYLADPRVRDAIAAGLGAGGDAGALAPLTEDMRVEPARGHAMAVAAGRPAAPSAAVSAGAGSPAAAAAPEAAAMSAAAAALSAAKAPDHAVAAGTASLAAAADTVQTGASAAPRRAPPASALPAAAPPAASPEPPVTIRICHGDLARAAHPVCVGHYQDDAIVHAEARLDQRLQGMLSAHARLGIYPGAPGTALVAITPHSVLKPEGALVVGLGQVGDLTPGLLGATLHRALLDYALQVQAWYTAHASTDTRAQLSFLLIGTGAGGVSLRDSVACLLRAVQHANAALAQQGQLVRFDSVDIVELYLDLALQAASALRALLATELGASFVWPAEVLTDIGGGLVRARGIEPPGWWRRLEIAYDDAAGTLRYVELTDRARAEETLTRAQTQLVRSFLTQAVAGSAADQDIARTLYEMLLPLRLRDSTQAGRDSVLLLDRQAAAFPWELLEDRWSANTLPPAVAAGMVRQLKTDRFRAVPARAAGLNALVIGNPSLVPGSGDGPAEFADLPGARAEAQAVAQTLQAAGYAVTSEIGGDATSCVIGLHGGAYRVVHLAGHGVIDYVAPGGAEAASGMMVGHGMVLTPADIAQMRWVPALVFLNCCHLGAERSHGAARYHELAANLGSQFIEMGVQAVVAAGWALDDAAAATFAAAFYQGMLSGQPFGAAVRQARLAAYTLHPQVNTWGAYQCYGDPHFSLSAASAQPSAAQPAPPYFATGELLAELDNLLAREAAADLPPVLARVPDMVRGAWLARPEVGQRLARLGWQPQSHP